MIDRECLVVQGTFFVSCKGRFGQLGLSLVVGYFRKLSCDWRLVGFHGSWDLMMFRHWMLIC